MSKITKIVGWCFASFLGLVLIYIVIAMILSRVLVNKNDSFENEIQVYVRSNGVHTDIVVPIKTEVHDWSLKVKPEHVLANDTNYKYLAFGWGDRAFYLETPNWSDLTFKTAFNAAFGLGRSAMHATFYKAMVVNSRCRPINLSKAQYANLVKYIESSFQASQRDKYAQIVSHPGYSKNDTFYEAIGRYSMFHTCNTWTNNALKSCNQKACLWTPFDKGILYHYRNPK